MDDFKSLSHRLIIISVKITIINNVISQSSGASNIYYLGTGSSFDLKSLLPNIDYSSLTIDNFIVSTISISSGSYISYAWSCSNSPQTYLDGSSLIKSYNNTTGILSLSGLTPRGRGKCDNLWAYSNYGYPSFEVYLVLGQIVGK